MSEIHVVCRGVYQQNPCPGVSHMRWCFVVRCDKGSLLAVLLLLLLSLMTLFFVEVRLLAGLPHLFRVEAKCYTEVPAPCLHRPTLFPR